MRLIIDVLPPNAQATRSNSKRPTRPQLSEPIILKIKQILFEDFNLSGRKTFSCCLTVKEIEKFMLFLIETIKGS